MKTNGNNSTKNKHTITQSVCVVRYNIYKHHLRTQKMHPPVSLPLSLSLLSLHCLSRWPAINTTFNCVCKCKCNVYFIYAYTYIFIYIEIYWYESVYRFFFVLLSACFENMCLFVCGFAHVAVLFCIHASARLFCNINIICFIHIHNYI